MCKTVAPVAIDFRDGFFPLSICNCLLTSFTAELDAIHRGLTEGEFDDEFTPPATPLIRYRASPPAENDPARAF